MIGTFDWSRLRVEQDGRTVVAPCLSFTMWFAFTDAALLLDFYERSMDALGSLFTTYVAESMKQPAPITPRALGMVSTWLRKPAALKFYFAELRGAADVHGASLRVHFRHRPSLTAAQQEMARRNLPVLVEQGLLEGGIPSTAFRVTVPLDHPLAEPARFAAWTLDFAAVRSGEFLSGGCDLALNHAGWLGDDVTRRVRALCSIHPGLDFFDSGFGLWLQRYEEATGELLPLVKRPGWITLVDQRAVAHLGGVDALAASLAPDTAVRTLAHGVALQSGDAPRLGALARADLPYTSAAAAIRPVLLERAGTIAGFPDEWVTSWLRMLDGPAAERGR